MSRLNECLIEDLISLTTSEKEDIGNTLVLALGGNCKKQVIRLPKRRGNGDGGIDGRIPIYRRVKNQIIRPNGKVLYDEKETSIDTVAAVSVKMQKKEFTREQFGGFTNDMERENIFEGIIITARGLCPDAQAELDRKNEEGRFCICNITITDILDDTIECPFELKKDLKVALEESLRKY